MIDKGTIGSSAAENYLNDVLIESKNKKLVNAVMRLYFKYREGLEHLATLDSKKFFLTFLYMWRERFVTDVENKNWPLLVKQLMLNCIAMQHRRALTDYKEKHRKCA